MRSASLALLCVALTAAGALAARAARAAPPSPPEGGQPAAPERAQPAVPERARPAAPERARPAAPERAQPAAPEGAQAAPRGRAQAAPPEGGQEERYSGYERATIERVLSRLGARLDPSPEGKIVEAIDVVPLEVIEDRDPAPGFLNWFHAVSRPYVIRREVLLAVGRPYVKALADETARNLRGIRQVSLVLVFAVQSSRPDRVRVVVVTKDIWSLRLNSDYRFAGGALERLFLQPSEENLLGSHQSIALQLELDPGALSLGAAYSVPRIGGSRVALRAEVNAIVGRESGELEGSHGELEYGQPLYAAEAEWAWEAKIAWRNEVTRRFVGTKLAAFDADVTEEVDRIPYRYRSDQLVGSYRVTRSFGGAPAGAGASGGVKHDVSVGIEASRKVFRAGDLSGFAPAAVEEFERSAVPVSDTRIGPAFTYSTYSTRFLRVLDFNTLGLQEDYRVGHELVLKIYPVTTALNSSRDFLGVYAAGAYTVPLGDGLARAVVKSVTELERSRIADASIDLRARVHTPSFGFGRLVLDAQLLHRYRNHLNLRSQLGGETRLRGYPTRAFLGKDVLSANLELRTRPVEVWSCQIAGVSFFDVGDAFDGFRDLRVKQSAGVGLRILFPQLDRVVMRADWGIPLTRGYREPDAFPGDIVVTFRQAFPMLPADE